MSKKKQIERWLSLASRVGRSGQLRHAQRVMRTVMSAPVEMFWKEGSVEPGLAGNVLNFDGNGRRWQN
jgi:hypothetical protein